jgi:hypothetical protein
MPLRRYKCPACGSSLSRTTVHREWLSLKAVNPEFRMPLVPVLGAVAGLGLGLAFLHPALGVLVALAAIVWLYWRYFSYLQCESCKNFYFGGQLSGSPKATVPWTRSDVKKNSLRVVVVGALFALVFTPLYLMERRATSNCAAECARAGSQGVAKHFKCTCVSASVRQSP